LDGLDIVIEVLLNMKNSSFISYLRLPENMSKNKNYMTPYHHLRSSIVIEVVKKALGFLQELF
jgi:hypothetical protein